jgi:hypothetical protein
LETWIKMPERLQNQPAPETGARTRWVWLALGLIGAALPAALLARVSSGYQNLSQFPGFLGMLVLAGGLIFLGWWALRGEGLPSRLPALTLGAMALRLAAGLIWYVALPAVGYGSEAELGGYVMADAYERDQAAWELGSSDKLLSRAFLGAYRKSDQYGGMLFVSALIYRTFGGEVHAPLLVVVFGAAVSALAVMFLYAFAARLWDGRVAGAAALALALYPEAVLLGSSQMREAFLVTFVIMAFYGLAGFGKKVGWQDLAWVLLAVGLSLFFSPPFAALLTGLVAVQALAQVGTQLRTGKRARLLWIGLAGLGLLAAAGLWLSLRGLAPEGVQGPLDVLAWWARRSATYQLYLNERASGWFQKIFDGTPQWMHIPLLVGYGIFQPFLPAAISDVTGAAIWRGIAIWRALGWSILLPFLVYAPTLALRRRQARQAGIFLLSVLMWVVILIAAYRSGGDQWDNPRYRAAFAALQIGLAAWSLVEWQRSRDPWLRRALVGLVIILAWFLPWYLRRYVYLPWPVEDPFKILGMGVCTAGLYILADWARAARQK